MPSWPYLTYGRTRKEPGKIPAAMSSIGITPHRQATDEQLVLAALVGGIAAFDELVRRYRAAIILVAEHVIGSRAAAEDVAQEVFLLAFKALPSLDEPAKFAGWLRAIARHRAQRVATR